ncbi:MAG: TonB-dependent Receptor Plug Domain [Massilia sp.]|nr:TonB-dependent Receptor Plug Domain [Massilia sp.]
MNIPIRRSVMNLAVASACWAIAASSYAQQAADTAAAAPAPAPEKMDVVTVSGSRIAARGFSQPTPTTSLSAADLLLIKRVDVFTGGASAWYGSDAVAGVVNFITDKKFTGFKANPEGGETTYSDDKHGTVQAAFGKAFFDDRLHLVGGAEYGREKGVPNPGFGGQAANGREWYKSTVYTNRGAAATTDRKPQLKVIDNAQQIQYAKYGLITDGPLRGTTFGANSAPSKFQYGTNCVGS